MSTTTAKKAEFSAFFANKLYNINKLFRYHESKFDSQEDYWKDVVSRLQHDSPDCVQHEISKQANYLKHKLLTGSKKLGTQWQTRIERMFDLAAGTLDYPALRKKAVYVLVSCRGKDAQLLYKNVTENHADWHIVDECAFVAGSYDLMMRLYGTEDEISTVLSEQIYNVPSVQIQGTNSLFSFNDYVWQRYPIGNREKNPSAPYWYDS